MKKSHDSGLGAGGEVKRRALHVCSLSLEHTEATPLLFPLMEDSVQHMVKTQLAKFRCTTVCFGQSLTSLSFALS